MCRAPAEPSCSRDTVLLDFNGCKILGWYKDWREPYVASDSYYSGGG